jgi:hypothetical protein
MRTKSRLVLAAPFAALLTGVSPADAAQDLADGRVSIRLSERWDVVPGLPSLMLDIATVHKYPTTGYCLNLDWQERADTLDVTLRSVNRCMDIVGQAFTPAAAGVRLGRVDTIPDFPRVIRLRYQAKVDTYVFQFSPQGGRLVPSHPLSFSELAESRRLHFMQRNWVAISCHAPHRRKGCLCEEFLRTALYRGHMSGEPLSRGEISSFQPQGMPDSMSPTQTNTFVAAKGVRLDDLLALATDFTRVFDGMNDEAGQSLIVYTGFALWDGRNYTCTSGKCIKQGAW